MKIMRIPVKRDVIRRAIEDANTLLAQTTSEDLGSQWLRRRKREILAGMLGGARRRRPFAGVDMGPPEGERPPAALVAEGGGRIEVLAIDAWTVRRAGR